MIPMTTGNYRVALCSGWAVCRSPSQGLQNRPCLVQIDMPAATATFFGLVVAMLTPLDTSLAQRRLRLLSFPCNSISSTLLQINISGNLNGNLTTTTHHRHQSLPRLPRRRVWMGTGEVTPAAIGRM